MPLKFRVGALPHSTLTWICRVTLVFLYAPALFHPVVKDFFFCLFGIKTGIHNNYLVTSLSNNDSWNWKRRTAIVFIVMKYFLGAPRSIKIIACVVCFTLCQSAGGSLSRSGAQYFVSVGDMGWVRAGIICKAADTTDPDPARKGRQAPPPNPGPELLCRFIGSC